jgi:hypothetical protein
MYSFDRLESEQTVEELEEEERAREEEVLERWASCIYFASNKLCVVFLLYNNIGNIIISIFCSNKSNENKNQNKKYGYIYKYKCNRR